MAEEYERRVKNSRKMGTESEEIDLFYYVSYLAQRVHGSFHIKSNFGEGKMELLKWVNEPKTKIGTAAITGFFSA